MIMTHHPNIVLFFFFFLVLEEFTLKRYLDAGIPPWDVDSHSILFSLKGFSLNICIYNLFPQKCIPYPSSQ